MAFIHLNYKFSSHLWWHTPLIPWICVTCPPALHGNFQSRYTYATSSFLSGWINKTPWCKHATFHLPIWLLEDIWVVSIFWLLYKNCFKHWHSNMLHVVLFSILWFHTKKQDCYIMWKFYFNILKTHTVSTTATPFHLYQGTNTPILHS